MDPKHGGDIYAFDNMDSLLDFSVNVNPLGMPPGAVRAAKEAVDLCARYPDALCRDLKAALSVYEQVSGDNILCGNGAADLIFRIAFGLRPASALILAPTFSEYRQALEAAGCRVSSYLLGSGNHFAADEGLLERIEGHDLVFLCNPNNPTGRVIRPELLEAIVVQASEVKAVLVVDECFLEFLPHHYRYTAKNHLDGYGNLLILKAFTKTYGMPGLRLGYLLGSGRSLLERVEKAGPPWNVSIPAQAAGIAALGDKAWLDTTRGLVEAQRAHLTKGLEALGFWVCKSRTNYLLFRCDRDGDLCGDMAGKGILIRGCDDYEGLDNRYYRVAVRREEENNRLLKALGEILE